MLCETPTTRRKGRSAMVRTDDRGPLCSGCWRLAESALPEREALSPQRVEVMTAPGWRWEEADDAGDVGS
ncbi:hypothetical protein ACH4FX_40480 [Streptomyces sp. NPDC018019]|uniref:hypothetical protein n=1 Tax=Streptomyces sp. NPDC018019 TaxID=3365030 RepID=UPI0037A1FDF9